MNNPALNTYRQFSVQGATPLGLVVMLYDGAIATLRRAASAMEAGDIPRKCAQLNRALAIVAQLEGTLNFESGRRSGTDPPIPLHLLARPDAESQHRELAGASPLADREALDRPRGVVRGGSPAVTSPLAPLPAKTPPTRLRPRPSRAPGEWPPEGRRAVGSWHI